MLFFLDNLQIYQMSVYLQRVFHSIRFKVNKGWSTAVLLFLCPCISSASFSEPSFFTLQCLLPPFPLWGIERSVFFNGREKWAKGFENQRV